LRFWNDDVLTNLEGVATVLLEAVNKNTPHPTRSAQARSEPPSPTRGEGWNALQRSAKTTRGGYR
jgi:hypothetical protein